MDTVHETKVHHNGNGKSLGDLVSRLTDGFSTLARQEVALAKAEISQKAREVVVDFGMLGTGAALGFAALLTLVASAVLGLALVIPAWASALVVGVVVALVAFAVAKAGLNKLGHADLKPRQTVDSMKENKRWMKEQFS